MRQLALALGLGIALIPGACGPAPPVEHAPPMTPPAASRLDAGLVARADAKAEAPKPEDPPPPLVYDLGPGYRERPRDPANLCEPARSNLERTAASLLAAPPLPPSARSVTGWDRTTEPLYLKRMTERFGLTPSELQRLRQNGFVVLERESASTYTDAYHEIYRSELPLYVSVDAILHAVFRGHEAILSRLERELLEPQQKELLDRLHASLPAAAARYPADTTRDLDLYLTVARSFAHDAAMGSALSDATVAKDAASLVALGRDSKALSEVELFGRRRVVDFSRYLPRGRYAKHGLEAYFRSATWLVNLELNLVSRGGRSSAPGLTPDTRETPREALLALSLADLAERAGALGDVEKLERTWQAIAGDREDVGLVELSRLRARSGLDLRAADAFESLRKAIGGQYTRTTRVHYMPQGSRPLPAIATFLGPRITPDTTAMAGLVHGDVPSRFELGAGDVGYLLGHDRAEPLLLREQLTRHPELRPALERGRAALAAAPQRGLFGSWLGAVRALASRPEGAQPSFARTGAFSDMRLGSALVAYGQLRHEYVLMAAQAYDEGGCVIPDGFVDPAPEVYAAIVRYAAEGATLSRGLGHADGASYFERLGRRVAVLLAIARHQLAGQPLPEDAKRWMSMVVEILPPSSEGPGSFDGWYFDLFATTSDAFETPAFVSDYYASANTGRVSHLGAELPRLALFVVDHEGSPRVMVGPVARGYEARAHRRLTERDARSGRVRRESPWSRSFLAPAGRAPSLALEITKADYGADEANVEISVRGEAGPLLVTLLDHHRRPIASATTVVGPGLTKVRMRLSARDGEVPSPEAWQVRRGSFTHFATMPYGLYAAKITLGGAKEP